MAEFGELIAELRQDRGLTQKQLGKILSVSTGTISNYENGVHYPDLEKLVTLADYFQVSTDYLLGRTGYSGAVQQPQPQQLRDELLEQMMHNISHLSETRRKALALIVADLLTAKQLSGDGDDKKW